MNQKEIVMGILRDLVFDRSLSDVGMIVLEGEKRIKSLFMEGKFPIQSEKSRNDPRYFGSVVKNYLKKEKEFNFLFGGSNYSDRKGIRGPREINPRVEEIPKEVPKNVIILRRNG